MRPSPDDPLLFAKHPEVYAKSALATANGWVTWSGGPGLAVKRALKPLAATRALTYVLTRGLGIAERLHAPQALLDRGYRAAVALAIFKGWREGPQRADAATPIGSDRGFVEEARA
jgi:hypothetical protein